ncbi:beta-ketoacyl-ACP synthase [Alteromonas confluentis]|uniref:Beta-ketoacyl-ACP synthase II n=1 Tax=Alteromonas confluentis TaxID=1656094 RepID=A0A1E7ZAT3_9ALTE|nr:beta-ketoacyl-ACP synthase [Alteromonas confluentis]OFC70534.1 beta-ketoacyl-ACP synthase II [Alteromonas confluentis]
MNSNNDRRVVITGAGVVSALGDEWSQVKSALQSMKSAVCYMEDWKKYEGLGTYLAAPIHDFALPDHYTKKKKRSMGRVAQMGVLATERALADAGLTDDPVIRSSATGVAYGSATGSSEAALEFAPMLENFSTSRINSSTYLRMMNHTAAVNISVYFGTQGRMYTTSSACTAGSQAIGYAYEAIKFGQQDVMIAGGAEELCPSQAAVFDTLFAASTKNDTPEATPRPYDRDRDGLVLGEGACTLILESYEHAKARGANILAEVTGYATNTDGAYLVKPNPETVQRVMASAMKDAGVTADDIGYVSAHGTATQHGDIVESNATYQVVGAKPISSLKSYTGHTLGACGSFEVWATINMMKENWFAPTLNLDNVDPDCAPLDYIRQECREIKTDCFMSNNLAFGGINTSLIIKRV